MILLFLQLYLNRAKQPAHYTAIKTRAPPKYTAGAINSTARVWIV